MDKKNITFLLTYEQATSICEKFGKNIDDLEEYEVCELLDKIIDEATD